MDNIQRQTDTTEKPRMLEEKKGRVEPVGGEDEKNIEGGLRGGAQGQGSTPRCPVVIEN